MLGSILDAMEHPFSSVEASLASSEKMTTRDVADFIRAAECLDTHPFRHCSVVTWMRGTTEDNELGRVYLANGSSIAFYELCPLKRLAFRKNWLPPSDADYAFVEACSRRLHARMAAAI